MGNRSTQEPFENDATGDDDTTNGVSYWKRVVDGVRAAASRVRRQFSIFSRLDLERAFNLDTETFDAQNETTVESGDTPQPPVPKPFARQHSGQLPERDQPFTQPAPDGDNDTDLESKEEQGQLSIYHPDYDGATITSDTWKRIER
jgi:hypothetical protein